jgi:hypothetical protein
VFRPFAGGAIVAGTGPDTNIAHNPTYAGDYFIGAIDDVRIYEQALSAAQVLALNQAVTPPSPSEPTAECTLTQASVSGAIAADAKGNGKCAHGSERSADLRGHGRQFSTVSNMSTRR